MNGAQIHLAVNHLPVVASVLGVAALLSWVVLRKTGLATTLRRAGLGLLVVAAFGGAVSNVSGEEAEEQVEGLAGVSEDLIHEHEEAAEPAAMALVLAGILALAGIAGDVRKARWTDGAAGAALAVGLVGFALVARAAHAGGLIRHPELRQDAAAPAGEHDGR